jgi:transcriptional regulator with XRE-family HTH domain
MTEERDAVFKVLQDDLDLMREMFEEFEDYRFSADVRNRMNEAGLSANALAERTKVSHTAVGKWLSGETRPQGKERMKMLGMALGLSAAELDNFLFENGYPRLYVKNPLDNASQLILKSHKGRSDIVPRYLDFLEMYCAQSFQPTNERFERASDSLSKSFEAVDSAEAFAAWLERNSRFFGASALTVTANLQLMRRVYLYIGESSINDLYAVSELSLPVRNLLYALLGSHKLPVKGFRNKLIAFGLYENMIEEEFDMLLADAKLRGISEPKTRAEQILLTAVRTAHERYPYYEYETMQKLTNRIRSGMLLAKDEEQAESYSVLLAPYAARLDQAATRAGYYDEHKTKDDEMFEQRYTSYSDCGMIHYVVDVLTIFAAEGAVEQAEVNELTALLFE